MVFVDTSGNASEEISSFTTYYHINRSLTLIYDERISKDLTFRDISYVINHADDKTTITFLTLQKRHNSDIRSGWDILSKVKYHRLSSKLRIRGIFIHVCITDRDGSSFTPCPFDIKYLIFH